MRLGKTLKLTLGIISLGALLLSSDRVGHTVISGPCANCHTMHASQNGTSLGGPNPALILGSGGCLACHSDSSASGYKTVAGIKYPIVYTSGGVTGNTTAGGNFYYVTQNATYGHNVAGITSQDSIIGSYTPPGFNATYAGWGPSSWSQQLTCGGTYGCHGIRTNVAPYNDVNPWVASFAAIRGLHHKPDTYTPGSTAYRMLFGDASTPIKGKPHPTWEVDGTGQNVYYGASVTGTPDKATISFLCAQCHGNFHQRPENIGSSSPWLRHPTDIPLAGTWSYFQTDYGTTINYNKETPVAFTGTSYTNYNATTAITTFSKTDAIVMCLSCHRAHASPYPDILRFNYASISAGSGSNNGCLRCHSRQR